MAHPAVGANELHLARRPRRPSPPAPPTAQGTEYHGALDLHERRCGTPSPSAPRPRESRPPAAADRGLLLGESLEHRASVAVAGRCCPASSRASSARLIVRGQGLPGSAPAACKPHRPATRFDASLVVAGRRPREARLRRGSGRPAPRTARSALARCRPAIRRTAARRLSYSSRWGTPPKWAKARTCPSRKQTWSCRGKSQAKSRPENIRPQQKQPRLPPLARDVHQHLEEVDLRRGLPAGRPAARRPPGGGASTPRPHL